MDDLISRDDKIILNASNHRELHIFLKREDLLHPEISGNKWRKLRHNIKAAKENGYSKILTFGGAFSNHLAATAAAGKIYKISTIGIIRGEPHPNPNDTLKKAQNDGMTVHYISRTQYKEKNTPDFTKNLSSLFGPFYLIPEGGANKLGVKGCMEILNPNNYDYIACPAGTGATCAGILLSLNPNQKLLCFPALKGGHFLRQDIYQHLMLFVDGSEAKERMKQLILHTNFHFGGFGKTPTTLIAFMRVFNLKNKIKLDPIYTAKMLYGLGVLVDNHYFYNNAKILAIHTGGLQGIKGMEEKLKFSIY